MEITLASKKKIIIQDEKSITTDYLSNIKFTDDGLKVDVTFQIGTDHDAPTKSLTIWEGQAYINVGQYKDEDIKARIIELL